MHHHLLLLLFLLLPSTLSTAGAIAPAAAPSSNFTTLLSKTKCKAFTALLLSTPDAAGIFDSNLLSGLTVFCPSAAAVAAFLPTFKNLSAADQLSLLLFHGVPVYFSLAMLQSNNGLLTTLATDGPAASFNLTVQNDGQDVTLRTPAGEVRVAFTVLDEEPVAVYEVSGVLRPVELFELAPAPAVGPPVDTPAVGRGESSPEVAPGLAPEGKVADERGGAGGRRGGVVLGWVVAVISVLSVIMV